jgi:hypothetical protein
MAVVLTIQELGIVYGQVTCIGCTESAHGLSAGSNVGSTTCSGLRSYRQHDLQSSLDDMSGPGVLLLPPQVVRGAAKT